MAEEAGRIIFAAGEARIQQQAVKLDHAVQVGDQLSTGATGYIYLKTIDNGFLILRPNSSARIVAYHVDPAHTSNTRIKIELQEGVARHISGDAVKNAKQNFRFNTPVGAIGVRGTDFTVYTSQDLTRIAVSAGGVVLSGFSGSCRPEGSGPCEGNLSRELFANPNGQVLQITRGQMAPKILQGSTFSPDLNASPGPDEPGTSKMPTEHTRPPLNNSNLSQLVIAPPGMAPVTPPVSPPQVIWGRWQAVLDQPVELNVGELQKTYNLLAISGNYLLMRDKNALWQPPVQNTASFALGQHQAVILNEGSRTYTAASLENAQLNVNFAQSTFNTRFDLVSQSERFTRQAQGNITRDGQLMGDSQFTYPTNMMVRGVLSNEPNLTASYLFQTRLDAQRVASGVTAWTK